MKAVVWLVVASFVISTVPLSAQRETAASARAGVRGVGSSPCAGTVGIAFLIMAILNSGL